ncbi:MAG TPA: serine hydrolase domain-containing protein [Gemmatimonadales bacterium]|nr:serine hydrolase domain-containing protein [Gemmatimonadales bacterium]
MSDMRATTPVRAACFALIMATAIGGTATAQRSTGMPAGWRGLTGAFDRFVAAEGVIGGGMVLVRNGAPVAWHHAGQADRDARQAADSATIYHWGSITKTLTAIGIMQLRDRGLLSLDDPIVRWVPELRQLHNPFGNTDSITLRMLLSHSAGFQDPTWPYGEGKAWEPFEPTRWEQLVAMMPYQEIRFAPGSRYGYSNPAFIYLARVIESITGDPYQSYIQKNIWTPLGLTRSYFGATPYHLAEDRANSYTIRRDSAAGTRIVAVGRDFDPGITIPNGGWNAPLGDLASYASFLLGASGGDAARAARFDGVLRRSSIEEMWRSVVPVDGPESMGLSFFLLELDGQTIAGHTGQQAGFRSFLYLDPEAGTAVVGATNTINRTRGAASTADWNTLTRAAARSLLR